MALGKIGSLAGRSSAFTFLFYPECSGDCDLLFTFLDSLNIPSCVSPFHDKDVISTDIVTGDVEYKKAHYHVLLDFGSGSNKSFIQVFDILQPIRDKIALAPLDKLDSNSSDQEIRNVVKVWKMNNVVHNMRSTLRYFKHLDHPDKYQYINDDYRCFCGFDLENRILSQEDNISLLKDILAFVNREEMYLFSDLVDYCMENNCEWFSVVSKSTYNQLIISYMRSKVYDNSGKLTRDLNSDIP